MKYVVVLAPAAEADLERLFDFLLDQADTPKDLDRAQAAIDAIRATAQHRLAITPFSFRKAAQKPGMSRCMRSSVHRKSWCWRCAHQREEDYH